MFCKGSHVVCKCKIHNYCQLHLSIHENSSFCTTLVEHNKFVQVYMKVSLHVL
jgi:hypothetical protein